MCKRVFNCLKRAVKVLLRVLTCLVTCRWRRKQQKVEETDESKAKNRLTSIRIDEDTVNTVKQLLQNTPEPVTWSWPEADFAETQSIATTNTENFDLMESFFKDMEPTIKIKKHFAGDSKDSLVGAARGRRSQSKRLDLDMREPVEDLTQLGEIRDDDKTVQDAAWMDDFDHVSSKEITNISRESRRVAADKKRKERMANKKSSKQN